MTRNTQVLREVTVDELASSSTDVEDRLLLDVGVQHFSPRRTYEMVQQPEEQELSGSDVTAVRMVRTSDRVEVLG